MAKTALVLGATGLVGSQLVQQLAANSSYQRVIAFSRRPVNFHNDKVINQVLDFDCLEEQAELFYGDVLFSCLGTTRKQAGSLAAQRRVDFDYQLQLASIASANGVGHYCLVSSSGANEHSFSAYLSIKGQLEEQVKQLGFQRLSIFQPSVLVGHRPQKRLGEGFAGSLLKGLSWLPVVADYRPIDGAEVAAKMLAVSLQSGTGLRVYRLREVFLNGQELHTQGS